jgi:hypothetical protein
MSWTLQRLVHSVPLAALLAMAFRRAGGPTPVIGFATGAFVAMFAVAGWVLPALSSGDPGFFGTAFHGLTRRPLTLPEAFEFESSLGVLRLASVSLAAAASAAAFSLLGHQVARYGTAIRLFVAATAGAALIWIGYPTLLTPRLLGDLAVPFTLPALAFGATVALAVWGHRVQPK